MSSFDGTKVLNSAAGVTVSIQIVVEENKIVRFMIDGASTSDLSVNGFQVSSGPLSTLEAAMAKINTARNSLGAIQNRFQPIIADLRGTINDMSAAARSRIQDADYGTKISETIKAHLLG